MVHHIKPNVIRVSAQGDNVHFVNYHRDQETAEHEEQDQSVGGVAEQSLRIHSEVSFNESALRSLILFSGPEFEVERSDSSYQVNKEADNKYGVDGVIFLNLEQI